MVFASPFASTGGMTCTELLIPVTINTTNLVIPITATSGSFPIQGTYNIGARYCEPSSQSRAKTLQILVHGITYTRNYWSGAGPPGQGYQGNNYSWIAYAATEGYPTLSIDRLGNGLSSHPNPISEVQVNSEVATIHQLILKARNGTLTPNGRKFKKIIYVGHSFGSLLGNRLTAAHPADVDAAILTGWTPVATQQLLAVLPLALAPAAAADPARFGALNPYYFVINSTDAAVRNLFYYPNNYDPNLLYLDYITRGTVTYGEIISGEASPAPSSPLFTGPVLLLAGQDDDCFCPQTATGISCGTGWSAALAKTAKSLYPASRYFEAYALPSVGHCWNYHYRAKLGFSVAHSWLSRSGF